MSADGSWSVCTHEHLPDRDLFAMRLLHCKSCQQMVHGVCTHEHLPHRVLFYALATAVV
jgi:hypothetical protein